MRKLIGIFADPDLFAAMYLLTDVWDQNFESFHAFARSPLVYGGFEQPFLRHMMAERACIDTDWYEQALADPKKHLPKFTKFVSTRRIRDKGEVMLPAVIAKLWERIMAFLAEARGRREIRTLSLPIWNQVPSTI